MSIELDHLILPVGDCSKSIAFYTEILGFTREADREPFSVLRVSSHFVIQLAPWGTTGGEHLAFAMPKQEFVQAFARIKESRIAFGDRFDSVGNMRGPGDEAAARGMGKAVYFFDPDQHLIEIRYYEE